MAVIEYFPLVCQILGYCKRSFLDKLEIEENEDTVVAQKISLNRFLYWQPFEFGERTT